MSAVFETVFLSRIFLILITCVVNISANKQDKYQDVSRLSSPAPLKDQQKAVEELIERKLGRFANDFVIIIEPNLGPTNRNTFKINTRTSSKVMIKGNNAISVAWGFHYYLTQYVNSHFSWDGEWLVVPSMWPSVPDDEISITSNDKFRYMANMCTFSYSYQWYKWSDWEKHIDWMALNGINLPLASIGQEEIWRRVFMKFGFSEEEILRYFTGSGFLAWNRMGNIKTWGGPLSTKFLNDQVELQKKILNRMRSLSMIPITPSFSGFVPEGMDRLYPRVKVHRLPSWNKFNGTYSRNLLVDSEEKLFEQISVAFIEEYKTEFGTDHVYSADTFNEMSTFRDLELISSYGRAVYNGMRKSDSEAIWVMQGWIFQDVLFWTRERAKALLTSVPIGRMIVLDLFAEEQSRYQVYDSFYGQPFIWCMLHNFGGRSGFYGAIDLVNEGPLIARQANGSSMVGIGLAMEAIDQNYVIYEFMLEHTWLKEKRNVDGWIFNYARRRYGTNDVNLTSAWQRLVHSVYNFTITNRMRGPSFTNRPNIHMTPSYWYDPTLVFLAWDGFIKYALSSGLKNVLFHHDLVDLSRECMEIILMKLQELLILAKQDNDKTNYLFFNDTLMMAMLDLDYLLGTNERFLLGSWIAAARNSTLRSSDKDLFEFNARNQLTSWGPIGNVLDYAAKQWSGLVKGYYLKRWKMFADELYKYWEHFNQAMFNEKVMDEVELPFSSDRSIFPDKPIGDPVRACISLHQKYRVLSKILSW